MAIEEAFFESGGERCAATWYWPDGAGTRWPCVVLANGFSGTRDWILPDFARRFAAAGMAAFAFDYRHLGESGGTPRQIVDLKLQREDLRAALAHVRREPRIDAARLALWGTSLGGSHALAAAAEDPEVTALILNMPALDVLRGGNAEVKRKRLGVSRRRTVGITIRLLVTALRDLARAARGVEPLYLDVYGEPGEAFFTDPELAPRFRRVAEQSPLWQNRVAARFLLGAPRYREGTFERVAAPILICLAEHDLEVSADFIRARASGAARAELRVYPVGHFDLYHGAAFQQVVADQVRFLCAHLERERNRVAEQEEISPG
jgi:dienelactone hydrolase